MTMDVVRKSYKDGFFVDLADYYPQLHEYGSYVGAETETEDWVVDHVGDDWVILDCGAHIGYYTMLFSHRAPRGRVYAFEAGAEQYAKCLRNLEYNARAHSRSFDNVEVIRVALGDRDALALAETLYLSGSSGEYGKTRDRFDFITLDSFAAQRKLDRVDLIKVDVDSWDYEVLLGAKRVIQRFRPILVTEVNHALAWRGHSADDVARYMAELDYTYEVLDAATSTNWVMTPRERSLTSSCSRPAVCAAETYSAVPGETARG